MNKTEFAAAVRQLAADAGLRRISVRNRVGDNWVGVCSGIFIVMNLDSVRLYMELISPERESAIDSAVQGDPDESASPDRLEPEDEVDAFPRTSQAGLPGDWFEQNPGRPWGFTLVIDLDRRRELSPAALDGVLDCIVADLHDLGAETSQPCCVCQQPASTLGYFESTTEPPRLVPYCHACWEESQQATGGVLRTGMPRTPLRGWAFLLVGTLLMATIWGYSQHPKLGLPLLFLILGSGIAGFSMACGTAWFANGSNLSLRIGVAAGVIAATVAGNIVGFKLLVEAKGVVPWSILVRAYFLKYVPAHLGQELLFLSGGAIGVVLGFFLLRESERIRLR